MDLTLNGIEYKPLITVITASYNSVDYIEDCIKSVQAQSYDEIEHIIVDGGSNDGASDIIAKYAERKESRISWWCSESDNGIYAAWNKALKHASGEWIYFLGADDLLVNDDVMAKVIDLLSEKKDDMKSHSKSKMPYLAYGRVNVVQEDGHIYDKWGKDWTIVKTEFFETAVFGNLIPHQGVFQHISLFNDLGDFDTSFKIAGDSELITRALTSSNHSLDDRVWFLDLRIADFLAGGASGNIKTALKGWQENIKIYKNYSVPKNSFKRFRLICYFQFKIFCFSGLQKYITMWIADILHIMQGKGRFWTK